MVSVLEDQIRKGVYIRFKNDKTDASKIPPPKHTMEITIEEDQDSFIIQKEGVILSIKKRETDLEKYEEFREKVETQHGFLSGQNFLSFLKSLTPLEGQGKDSYSSQLFSDTEKKKLQSSKDLSIGSILYYAELYQKCNGITHIVSADTLKQKRTSGFYYKKEEPSNAIFFRTQKGEEKRIPLKENGKKIDKDCAFSKIDFIGMIDEDFLNSKLFLQSMNIDRRNHFAKKQIFKTINTTGISH